MQLRTFLDTGRRLVGKLTLPLASHPAAVSTTDTRRQAMTPSTANTSAEIPSMTPTARRVLSPKQLLHVWE